MEPGIDEYLRKRLMPVEGAIPHLSRTDMYGNSIPAGSVGGDLFEYINFQQRYNIDARIASALRLSREYLEPLPDGQIPRNSVDEHVQWLGSKSNPSDVREAEYRRGKKLRTTNGRRQFARTLHNRRRPLGGCSGAWDHLGEDSLDHTRYLSRFYTHRTRSVRKDYPKAIRRHQCPARAIRHRPQCLGPRRARRVARNRDHALRRNTSRRTFPLCKFRQPSTISVFGGVRALHTDEYRSPRAIPCARFGNSRGSS